MRRLAVFALATLLATAATDARAANECRVVQTRFKPADDLQIVVWLEDSLGNFVATMYVTVPSLALLPVMGWLSRRIPFPAAAHGPGGGKAPRGGPATTPMPPL